jgi:hypothetical protein
MNLIVTAATPYFNNHFSNLEKDAEFMYYFHKMLGSYQEFEGKKIIILHSGAEELSVSKLLLERGWIVRYAPKTLGALPTAMFGLSEISSEGPLFVAPGDSYVTHGYLDLMKDFRFTEFDACVPTISASGATWSYVRTTDAGDLLEIAEKRIISSQATTGFFGYRTASVFQESAKWALKNHFTLNDTYYVSSTIQAMLILGQSITTKKISPGTAYQYFGERDGRKIEN